MQLGPTAFLAFGIAQHAETKPKEAVLLAPEGMKWFDAPNAGGAQIPGGLEHSSGCAAGAPCVFFHEGSGKVDMKPVAPPQEKAAEPAKAPAPK